MGQSHSHRDRTSHHAQGSMQQREPGVQKSKSYVSAPCLESEGCMELLEQSYGPQRGPHCAAFTSSIERKLRECMAGKKVPPPSLDDLLETAEEMDSGFDATGKDETKRNYSDRFEAYEKEHGEIARRFVNVEDMADAIDEVGVLSSAFYAGNSYPTHFDGDGYPRASEEEVIPHAAPIVGYERNRQGLVSRFLIWDANDTEPRRFVRIDTESHVEMPGNTIVPPNVRPRHGFRRDRSLLSDFPEYAGQRLAEENEGHWMDVNFWFGGDGCQARCFTFYLGGDGMD